MDRQPTAADLIFHFRRRKILHDPEIYENPYAFNPDRFLPGPRGKKPEMDPRKVAFGFGRRVCPGRHMAYDAMWVATACVLACVDVRPKKGAPEVGEEFVNAFVR